MHFLELKESIREKQQKARIQQDDYKHLLQPDAGSECARFGLISRKAAGDYKGKVWIAANWATILTIIQMLKSIGALYVGYENRYYTKYAVEAFALWGSKPIWLFFHLLILVGCLCHFVIRFTFSDAFTQKWFNIIHCIRGKINIDYLQLTDAETKAFLKDVRRFFQVFRFFHYYLEFLSFLLFVPPYLYYYFEFDTLFILPIPLALYLGFLLHIYAVVVFPPLYLLVACYHITCCSRHLNNRLALIYGFRGFGNRNLKFQAILKQKAYCVVGESKILLRTLHDVNHFFRRIAPILLSPFLGAFLFSVFGIKDGYGPILQLVMFGVTTLALFILFVYFTLSAKLIAAVKRNLFWYYKCLTNEMPFRVKWHMMLITEYMSSKRNKIGIHCLHYFVFNHFTFLEFMMASTSIYFMLVRIGKNI